MDSKLAGVITPAERDAVMAPIERAMTLPARAYTDLAWFDLEVERIFRRRWMAVRFECALPAPGDVDPFDCLGMPLVAVRGDDHVLRVFHNVCPYDGCIAVRERSSALERIEVLYHGWRYDLRGRLLAAPYWNGQADCGPSGLDGRDVDLAEVRSEVRLGTLFIDVDGGAPDIDEWLSPWRATVGDEYAVDDLVPAIDPAGRALIEARTVDANWKTYQENASINILHEAFTHALYRKSPEVPRVDAQGRARYGLHLDGCNLAFSHRRDDSAETYDPIHLPTAGHDPAVAPGVGYFTTVYPNINVPLLDAFMKVNIVLPVAPDRTHLMHLRFYRPEAIADERFAEEEAAVQRLFDVVHREDRVAIEAVQAGRASPAWCQHYYAPAWDALHHRFNQLVMADLERG